MSASRKLRGEMVRQPLLVLVSRNVSVRGNVSCIMRILAVAIELLARIQEVFVWDG